MRATVIDTPFVSMESMEMPQNCRIEHGSPVSSSFALAALYVAMLLDNHRVMVSSMGLAMSTPLRKNAGESTSIQNFSCESLGSMSLGSKYDALVPPSGTLPLFHSSTLSISSEALSDLDRFFVDEGFIISAGKLFVYLKMLLTSNKMFSRIDLHGCGNKTF